MISIGRPITSAAEYPNSRSADRFHVSMEPSSVSVTIASSEEATTAASRNVAGSTIRADDIYRNQIIGPFPIRKAQQARLHHVCTAEPTPAGRFAIGQNAK